MGGSSARPRSRRAIRAAVSAAVVGALLVTVSPVGDRADAAGTCAGVQATNALGAATGWTEFVEGDGTRGSESEGAIAYGGNHSAGGMTVGTRLPDGFPKTSPALVVAGSHGSYNLQKGSAYLAPRTGVNFNGGSGTGYLNANPVDFGAAFAELRALSSSWGAAAATGTVTTGTAGGNAALVLSGASSTLNVFTLSDAQKAALAGGTHLALDAPAGATTIVNVPGATATVRGQMWIGSGSSTQQVQDTVVKASYAGLVWNFPDASSVTLSYGSAFGGTILAPNASVDVAAVGHTIGQVIAKSFSSGFETHQSLFPASACVPAPSAPAPVGDSDVTVTKTASVTSPFGGDALTYTLTARNAGGSPATGVVVRDQLPSGVTFVSTTSPCTQSAGLVTCSLGTLAVGASRTVTVTVTADPIAGAGPASHPQATHWLTPYKAEVQVDLEPGQQRSISVACTSGDILSDGTFRVDHVDQDTGTVSDVHVLSAQSTGLGTWKGVIRNDATGRAQAKAFVVCLPGRTEAADRQTGYADSHRHALSADTALVTATKAMGAGRSTAAVTCPTGTVPVAPGFDLSSSAAQLMGSEISGRTWTFTFDANSPVTATVSARCLRTTTSAVYGHTHELLLTHVVRTVTVPGTTSPVGDEFQVICPDDAKGVVATFQVPSGVVPLGNDPRLKARAFRLANQTGTAKSATVDLLCLHDRTSTEQMGTSDPVSVVNTATVTSTSPDANAANNAASATITVRPGSDTVTLMSASLARTAVATTLLSAVPGAATVSVRSGRTVVARGTVTLRAGARSTVAVKLTKKGKRLRARLRTIRVVVDPTRGPAQTLSVRVRR